MRLFPSPLSLCVVPRSFTNKRLTAEANDVLLRIHRIYTTKSGLCANQTLTFFFWLTWSVFHSFTRRRSELMLEKPHTRIKKNPFDLYFQQSVISSSSFLLRLVRMRNCFFSSFLRCENNTVIVIQCKIKQRRYKGRNIHDNKMIDELNRVIV